MEARIVRKLIIDVPLETLSPLRIASGFDDGITDILVLKDKYNVPFIPGSSVTGVLRSRIESIYGEEVAEKLFGSISDDGNQSMLNIHDVMLSNTVGVHRDGVAIDAFTGVGIAGAKYDYEAVERGAKGRLFIELTERKHDRDKAEGLCLDYQHSEFAQAGDVIGEVMAALADILTAGFKVGSLTAKGFGQIKAVVPAEIKMFDFTANTGWQHWLAYLDEKKNAGVIVYKGNAQNADKLTKQDFVMEVDLALSSSLLVRDMDAAHASSDDKNTIASVQMKSGDDYVIPGTSLKGVLRNRAKRILTAIAEVNSQKAEQFLGSLMGYANNKQAAKSRLLVEEIYIPKDLLQEVKHSRNRIDRFTGGTANGALFMEIPVWQQNKQAAPITMKLRVEKCSEEEAGLMLLLLKELWLGNLPVGGGKSIGRGVLKGRSCRIYYAGSEYKISGGKKLIVSGSKEQLEQYVKSLGVFFDV